MYKIQSAKAARDLRSIHEMVFASPIAAKAYAYIGRRVYKSSCACGLRWCLLFQSQQTNDSKNILNKIPEDATCPKSSTGHQHLTTPRGPPQRCRSKWPKHPSHYGSAFSRRLFPWYGGPPDHCNFLLPLFSPAALLDVSGSSILLISFHFLIFNVVFWGRTTICLIKGIN